MITSVLLETFKSLSRKRRIQIQDALCFLKSVTVYSLRPVASGCILLDLDFSQAVAQRAGFEKKEIFYHCFL